jgi:DNA repair exonuclease SbcCD nuclease subunit
MAHFRLLQITDLHISIPPDDIAIGDIALWMSLQAIFPSRARRPILQGVAGLAFHLRKTVDAFILSGDLADDGETRNLEAALSFIDEPARSSSTFLTSDEFPTLHDPDRTEGSLFITPGNHDRFRGPARLAGGTVFDAIFGSYWKKGLGGVQCLTLFKSGANLSLLSADMCLKTAGASTKAWGQGKAYRETVEALLQMTSEVRRDYPDSGILWILHFPPLLNVEASLALRSASDVITAAKTAGIKYIIAGHLHRDQQNNYDGIEIICTGSASSDMNMKYGNSVRLFDIEVAEGRFALSQKIYRYQPQEGAFIAS